MRFSYVIGYIIPLLTFKLFIQIGKCCGGDVYRLLDNDAQISNSEDKSKYFTGSQATQASQYRLLMKNLDLLEYMFADSDAVGLERDILEQLRRLGALRLFHAHLSRTLESSRLFHLSNAPMKNVDEPRINGLVENRTGKVIVQSGKKELRKSRRKRSLEAGSAILQEFPSDTVSNDYQQPKVIRNSRSVNKKLKIARNEADMATGVKVVSILTMQEANFANFRRKKCLIFNAII